MARMGLDIGFSSSKKKKAVVKKSHLKLSLRLWTIRLLVMHVQIGEPESSAWAEGRLLNTRGSDPFAKSLFLARLLHPARGDSRIGEHFLRVFDRTSRLLVLAVASLQCPMALVATIVFLRVVVVEGELAEKFLQVVRETGRFPDQAALLAFVPGKCPTAYKPLGHNADIYKPRCGQYQRIREICATLSSLAEGRIQLKDYKPDAVRALYGAAVSRGKSDCDVQFGAMQIAMDFELLLPPKEYKRFQGYCVLYHQRGPGCHLQSVPEISALSHTLSRSGNLRPVLSRLGIRSARFWRWFFLAEHADCAICKTHLVKDGVADRAAVLADLDRYKDPAKQSEYQQVLAILRDRLDGSIGNPARAAAAGA